MGGSGGGIDCDRARISHCIITGNSSVGGGGGLTLGANSVVISCTISYNSSGDAGGGIICIGDSIIISQCSITDNTSGEEGAAGIDIRSDTITISECLISRNSGGGGGIDGNGGYGLIDRCVISENQRFWGAGGGVCGTSERRGWDTYISDDYECRVCGRRYNKTWTIEDGSKLEYHGRFKGGTGETGPTG